METIVRSWDQKVINNVAQSSVGAGTDEMLQIVIRRTVGFDPQDVAEREE